jgi:hypothetical protein
MPQVDTHFLTVMLGSADAKIQWYQSSLSPRITTPGDCAMANGHLPSTFSSNLNATTGYLLRLMLISETG